MPIKRKSAADLVAEAKATAEGVPNTGPRRVDLSRPGKKTKQPKRSTSQAKIAANKANSQNSTGPKTESGKARASQNALKHGLCSEKSPLDLQNLAESKGPRSELRFADLAIDTALPNEHQAFLNTLAAFIDDLQPVGALEASLVEHLAQLDHRRKRAARIDTSLLDSACTGATDYFRKLPEYGPAKTDPKRTQDNFILAEAYTRCAKHQALLSHCEARITRDFARTLAQLLQLQKLRKQTQPIPISLKSQERTAPLEGDSQDRVPLCAINKSPSDGPIANIKLPEPALPSHAIQPAEPRASASDAPDHPSPSDSTLANQTSVAKETSSSAKPPALPPTNFRQTNPNPPDPLQNPGLSIGPLS